MSVLNSQTHTAVNGYPVLDIIFSWIRVSRVSHNTGYDVTEVVL